ncbi:MAG TPA: hypothetical protein VNB90_02320 [Cytophagaceae bacterium]|jgi:hypothetical protein|nr:hypothetical protein [Cytophagaceae bacterium]
MNLDYDTLIGKVEKFKDLSQVEQVKHIAYFHTIVGKKEEFTSTSVGDIFDDESLSRPSNVTHCLNILASKKQAILLKKANVYRFEKGVKKELDALFLDKKHVQAISQALRGLLPKVTSTEQRSFLEEAILCYEVKAYRAAIVMTWLLTMDLLYEFVINNKLAEFNAAAAKNNSFKNTVFNSKDDFSSMKENNFIMLLGSASIITGDQKKMLEEKLGIRNTAAHPNTIEIRESKVTNFIEDLIPNIISKFQ